MSANLVGQHRLEAAAEVAEGVPVLVDLNALSVVLDLRVHPVGTLLHGVLDGFTRLCLKSTRINHDATTSLSAFSWDFMQQFNTKLVNEKLYSFFICLSIKKYEKCLFVYSLSFRVTIW